ncbi:MAG: type II toxin-antitoxin system RelE/ParE family toxin [Bacteroidetes bacterium]|nr:type II toxin-antitoxin system RelE/ParE family toxin [Bacteroidota bacterium]
MTIILKRRASQGITSLIDYLISIGYPENAETYLEKIEAFIYDLSKYHHIYRLCERESWRARAYHCAVFDGKYVIPFKVTGDAILIMNFMHGSRIH